MIMDSVDKLNYPDPLSLNYSDTQLSVIPKLRDLSKVDLERFWVYMLRQYKMAEGDDILLTLNGVPYKGMLSPGDSIYLISSADLKAVGSVKKPGS